MAKAKKVTEPIKSENEIPVIKENQLQEEQKTEQDFLQRVVINDVNNVFESKRYVKGFTQFPTPKELLQPVLDIAHLLNVDSIHLVGENVIKNANDNGDENISFGRLNMITRFAIDEEMFYEVGLLVALDMAVPKVKVYRGAKVKACLNLCVFGEEDIITFDVNEGMNIDVIKSYLESATNKIQEVISIVKRMKEIPVLSGDVHKVIGHLFMKTIEETKTSGTNAILSGVNYLTDSTSKYYYKQDGFNLWLLFNAFTEYFEAGKKTKLYDIPEKVKEFFIMLQEVYMIEPVQDETQVLEQILID